MEFEDLETFLALPREMILHAPLPVPLVAGWMRVTPPAVKLMLARGTLQPIRLAGAEFVSAGSLKDWQVAFEADLLKARKALVKVARKGGTLAYSDLLARIGRDYANPGDRRRIGRLMVLLGETTLAEDGVLLPVAAISKQTGLPKHGVWDLAERAGLYAPGKDTPEGFAEKHLKKVAKTYAKAK